MPMHKKWAGKTYFVPQKGRRKCKSLVPAFLFITVVSLGIVAGRFGARRWKLALAEILPRKATDFGFFRNTENPGNILHRQDMAESEIQGIANPGHNADQWLDSSSERPERKPLPSEVTRSNRKISGDAGAAMIQKGEDPRMDSGKSVGHEDTTSVSVEGQASERIFVHDMDDIALFRKVMAEDQTSSNEDTESEDTTSQSAQSRKLAFMFLTTGSLPLAPLWNVFFSGNDDKFSIYVHSVRTSSSSNNEQLPGAFRGRRVPGKDFSWGHMSTVEAERRLLANALLDPHNSRFILVSDSCIPLFNFSFVYNYLMSTPFSFVEGQHVLTGDFGVGHWNADFLPLVSIRQWVNGGTWYVIRRGLASAVVRDFNFFTVFERACEFANGCYPEEHYIQTMLHMVFSEKLLNRSLTWEQKPLGSVTASWVSLADVVQKDVRISIVFELGVGSQKGCSWKTGEENTCHLFARSFEASTIDPLLRLAPHLGISSQTTVV